MPIKACAVVPSTAGPIELTAFFETGDDAVPEVAAVRAHLLQELGRVYLPKHVVRLPDGLPRTASGKPDMNVLKRLATERELRAGGLEAPAAESLALEAAPAPTAGANAADGHRNRAETSAVLGQAAGTTASDKQTWGVDLTAPLWGFCKDHRYRGEPIFPGSGYLALAAEVCNARGWDRWELQDAVFSKPLPLARPRPLRVTATPIAHVAAAAVGCAAAVTAVAVQIESHAAGDTAGGWHLHFSCTASPLHTTATVAPAKQQQRKQQCHQQAYSVPALYAQLADCGFDYGPHFQAMSSLAIVAGAGAGRVEGKVRRRHVALFMLEPVEIDACFQMSPLASPLGFSGAPTAIRRVRCGGTLPGSGGATDRSGTVIDVEVVQTDAGIDFSVSLGDVPLYAIEGLELTAFDAVSTPGVLELAWRSPPPPPPGAAPAFAPLLRLVSVGTEAEADAAALSRRLGVDDVSGWAPDSAPRSQFARKSVMFVVKASSSVPAGLEGSLPSLAFELPHLGRVWIVVVQCDGGGQVWQSAGRRWAAVLSSLEVTAL